MFELSENVFTDGDWHSALVEKKGGVVTMSVDEVMVARAEGIPLLIRSDSPLYIGGLPGEHWHQT